MNMSENISNLYDGFGIIYDDDFANNQQNTDIHKIVEQIESRDIPLVKKCDIPDNPENAVKHFRNVSFIILDWDFCPSDLPRDEGVRIGAALKNFYQNKIISFLLAIFKNTFCPVFIFSKESPNVIENVLNREFASDITNLKRVFICLKSELINNNLFEKIEYWLQTNLSVYTIKKWELEHSLALVSLFNNFEKINPIWPKVLWKNFSDDGISPSDEISTIISKNLHALLSPFKFSEEIFDNIEMNGLSANDIRTVLSGARCLPKNLLQTQDVAPGDLFLLDGKLFINIRPACDCIKRPPDDEIMLYLLQGSQLSLSKEKSYFNHEYGHFNKLECQAIVFALYNGKSYDFRFKNLKIQPWSEIDDKRIGRLLPPYITRIQQRYAAYLHREGLPRIPSEALSSNEPSP